MVYYNESKLITNKINDKSNTQIYLSNTCI